MYTEFDRSPKPIKLHLLHIHNELEKIISQSDEKRPKMAHFVWGAGTASDNFQMERD